MVRTRFLPEFQKQLPRVDGKVFVITGTTSGTGFVAARVAAELGGEVVLVNRPSTRSDNSLRELQKAVPSGKFVKIDCDLQSFDSVRKASKEIKGKYSKIYCLANNAGIMATPDKATVDGYDIQMQTNHLSHFLLTKELFPEILAASEEYQDARIVNHSSGGRNRTPNGTLEEKYFRKNGGNLGGDAVKILAGPCFERYFQTKLANSVFTYGLANKLKAKSSKVRAVAAHPGIATSNLSNHLNFGFLTRFVTPIIATLSWQSAEDGTMGLLYGMMHADAQSGALYGPKNNKHKGRAVINPPQPYENDPKQIEMLWRLSEEAVGEPFNV